MSKRTVFTTLTALPTGISRETVMETLHSHTEMIDLNPLVEERHPIKPPSIATAEEYHCVWYSLTDRVSYLPGGLMTGKVSYTACFHDLHNGLQTHVYAPMGLKIRGKWTLGGSLPGEPVAPVELGLGAPISGLYLREDVDMRCNIMMTSFVKKTLKKAHLHLVDRLLVKAQIIDAANSYRLLNEQALMGLNRQSSYAGSQSSSAYSPASYDQRSEYGDANSVEEGQRFGRAPQIPPLEVRRGWSEEFREQSKESLYPRALEVRSTTNSWDGCQNGRKTWQEPQLERVSWSNLNGGGRSTPPKQFMEPVREFRGNGYGQLEPGGRLPKSTYRATPAHYTAKYGAAELE